MQIFVKTLTGKNFTGKGYLEGQIELAKSFGFDTMTDEEINEAIAAEGKRHADKYGGNKGFKFKHLRYSDHYNFNKPSVNKISSLSVNKNILTTEKDFGRLKPKINDRKYFSQKYLCPTMFLNIGKKRKLHLLFIVSGSQIVILASYYL